MLRESIPTSRLSSNAELRIALTINLTNGYTTWLNGFIWQNGTLLRVIGPKTIQHVINMVVAGLGGYAASRHKRGRGSSKLISSNMESMNDGTH